MTNRNAILQRAQHLFTQGQIDEAEGLLNGLMSDAVDDAAALTLSALIAKRKGKLDIAEAQLLKAQACNPNNPEIINILGNVYTELGQIDSGLSCFDKALALNPKFADAHINRSLAAKEAGLIDTALNYADIGLSFHPTNPRLLAIKAVLFKEAGQTRAALAHFELALTYGPDRALTRHNYAATLRAAGRYEDACVQYRRAVELGMRTADVATNWAAASLEAGRIDEAEQLYRLALSMDMGHSEACLGLTRLIWEYKGSDRAFGHYAEAVRKDPENLDLHLSWIHALQSYRQYSEAAQLAGHLLPQRPDDPRVGLAAARAFCFAGIPNKAVDPLDRLIRDDETHCDALIGQMIAHIMLGEGQKAAAFGEKASILRPQDQSIWAYLATAWRMIDDPREDWLCGYETLIQTFDVNDAKGGHTAQDYATIVSACLERIHNSTREPGNQSLRHGTQTSSSLFERDDPVLSDFRDNILAVVQTYIESLPHDPAHPFLSRGQMRKARFSGSWSVRLQGDGGRHVPHFHANGWISSAFYARLPMRLGKGSDHSGHIQFGAPPENLGLALSPRRLVQPTPGRLVLFPSYVWHGTLPFSGTDTRLTAAFDIVTD